MVKKVIMIMIIFQIMFVPIVNASTMDSIFTGGDQFLQEGKNGSTNLISQGQLQNSVNYIYNVLFALGVGLAVIIGAILGIKYMTGSIEEQAKIKETLIPYAVGCIIVFGAFGIWKLVITIGGNIF